MALLQDLIQQIDDPALRERILKETNKLVKQKKFGLVFEDHLPECSPLYDVPICVGSKVSLKSGQVNDFYIVLKIDGTEALCDHRETHEKKTLPLNELVTIAEFGEPIYPTLKPIDYVENAPDSDLWHTLIEADNYHALQLLEYLYASKVDCIYIDPPYNTGAKDWKYNNDYVDSSDSYRHSKWLSMIEKRLLIAKKLLCPEGVLIIAIDKNELAHLVCLLEKPELFSAYDCTIVSVVHNPRGNITTNFAETNEYAIYLTPKGIMTLARSLEDSDTPRKLRRWGHFSLREERRSMFYPVYVKDGGVIGIGEQPSDDFHPAGRNNLLENGTIEVWPIDQDGIERRWNYSYGEMPNHYKRILVLPKDEGIDLFLASELKPPKTVWISPELDAGGVNGSTLVENIVGTKFPYPKSLYTVVRSIEAVVKNKPNCLVVDFFAGSGTTLHALNLINSDDGGKRRCIMITNNEVSEEECQVLEKKGLRLGDELWKEEGICRSITWPRTKNSIIGRKKSGEMLEGYYLSTLKEEKLKKRMFKKLDFITTEMISTSQKKKQLISLLGKEKLAQSLVTSDSKFIVSPKYRISILFDDNYTEAWIQALDGQDHIQELYMVTNNTNLFNNTKLKLQETLGDYSVFEQKKCPMANGFNTNVAFFKLSFLDKTSIALGRQLKELLPVLWMKGGAVGKCPIYNVAELPYMMVLSENNMAILVDETYYVEFEEKLNEYPNIQTVFIVTDSESAYREMIRPYESKNCYQLYRDYLDNFRINTGR